MLERDNLVYFGRMAADAVFHTQLQRGLVYAAAVARTEKAHERARLLNPNQLDAAAVALEKGTDFGQSCFNARL
jgi:hypothetical protein